VITAIRGRLLPPEPPLAITAGQATRPAPATASPTMPAASSQNGWQTHAWWLIPAIGVIAIVSALRGLSASRRRLGSHNVPALLPLNAGEPHALSHPQSVLIAPASSTGSTAVTDSSTSAGQAMLKIATPHEMRSEEDWKRRALIAEKRARDATELVRRGLLPQVSEWLRGKMLSKLIGDRARTAEMQEEATLKTLHVDERLARVEQQIQQQHRAYQDRIDALTRELRAARSENCDLIRAQINQVKAEMEASRARLLAEAAADFPK
jgi:hypothetical protein